MSAKVRELIEASQGDISRLSAIDASPDASGGLSIVSAHDEAGICTTSRILTAAEREALEMMLGGRLS